MKKIKIGLTGGMGSGKSLVSNILSTIGIPIYDSDTEAKRLTIEDVLIRKELTNLLGKDLFFNDSIDKKKLATYLFASAANAQRINSIIHPCVKKDFKSWAELQPTKYVAIESAILIEAGFVVDVDYVVLVYAPKELRIERTMKRDRVSKETVESRFSRQLDDEKKKEHADFIIVNDGVTPLIPQIYKLLEDLSLKE